MDYEKLRSALLMHAENYVCSACMNVYEKCRQIEAASDEELVKMAEKLNFDLSKYKS